MLLKGIIALFAIAKKREISLPKILEAYARTYVRIAELKRPKL